MPEANTLYSEEVLVDRLFGSAIGAMEMLSVYVGERLGLYQALQTAGPSTTAELAARADVQPHLLREWLEQQTVSGFLAVDDSGSAAPRFSLPAEHSEVFTNPDSLSVMTPFARFLVGVAYPLPALLDAFRTGGGVPYGDYGVDLREGQAEFTRPMFVQLLGQEWLPALPEVHARLQADPPARVADVASGGGLSSIAIARAYPQVRVDGIDLDAPSIDLAKSYLTDSERDVQDRVTFIHGDAADPALAHQYDLVTIFEALHDMARPVEVLSACRELLAPGGAVLIGDERVGETFTGEGDDMERLLYLFSVLHCLPSRLADGTDDAPSLGTGAVMRAPTVRAYAEAAGFSQFQVTPIENDFWRFYLLRV